MGLFGLHLPKQVDNVFSDIGQAAQGVARQVNPFDNGATYSHPQGQGPAPPSIATQVRQNVVDPVGGFLTPVYDVGKGLLNTGYHIGTIPIEGIRTDIGEATGNDAAAQAGAQRLQTGLTAGRQLLQTPGRMLYSLGESMNPAGGDVYQREHTFQNPAAKFVFGSDPIVSMQKQYNLDKQQHGTAYARGNAVTTAVMDALMAKGGAESATKGIKGATDSLDNTAHVALLNADPAYAAMQHALEKSTNAGEQATLTSQMKQIRSNALQTGSVGKNVMHPDEFKYKNETATGTNKFNALNDKNSFQDVNGVSHPNQSNATFFVDENGMTKDYKVNNITGQAHFNNLIKKYGQRGKLISVNVDESPALNTPTKIAPMAKAADEINTTVGNTEAKTGKNMITVTNSAGAKVKIPASEWDAKAGLPKELTKKPEPITAKNNPDQYAEMMDAMPSKPDYARSTGRVSVVKVTPDEVSMGKALGMTKQDVINAKAAEGDVMGKVFPQMAAKMTDEEKAALSSSDQMKLAQLEGFGPRQVNLETPQQTPNSVINLTAKTPEGAISENTYHMGNRAIMANDFLNKANELSETDQAKLSDAMNGEKVGKVENPTLFKQMVQQGRQYYDNSLALIRSAGGKTPRFNNGKFSPLYFQASAEAMDKLGIPAEQRFEVGGKEGFTTGNPNLAIEGKDINPNYTGFHNMERKYRSYSDAAAKTQGILQPLNKNALEDMRMYHNASQGSLEGNLLYQQLHNIAPDQVTNDLNMAKRKGWEAAANGNLPFAATEELNKQLSGFKSSKVGNPVGEAALKAFEVPAKGLRKVAFLTAPIHYANLTRSFLSTAIPSGHGVIAAEGMGEALGSSIHPEIYAKLEKAASVVQEGDKYSVREFAGKMGIVDRDTRPNMLSSGTEGAKVRVEKFNPFNLQMRNMNRFNNVLGWKLAEVAQKLGVDPSSAEGQAIGSEINKVIDRINPKKEGTSPLYERIATSGSLAPHWIRANIGLVKDAVKSTIPNFGIDSLKDRGVGSAKTGFGMQNAGDIARTNVIGGHLMVGAVAVIASAIATGKMPTFSQAINEAGLTPKNPTPNIQGNSQTKPKYAGGQRYHQQTNMPTDPIGLTVGLLTDPLHFAIARETPLLSAATQAASNRDWAGNPIVNKNQPGWQKELAVKSAEKLLPFTIQGAQNQAYTPGQKVEAAFGLRTKTNPNDPKYQANQNFFKGLDTTIGSQDTSTGRAIQNYFAPSKDPLTQNYRQPTVWDTIAKSTALLSNPNSIDAIMKFEQGLAAKGQKVDPLWLQDKAHIISYLQYQANPDPLSAQRSVWLNNNKDWYTPLSDQRSQFFNSLPPADPNKPAAPIEYPQPTTEVAQQMKDYYNLTDPKQQFQFMRDHPDLQAQFDAQFKYKNDLLQARGYAQYKGYPTAAPELQNYINSYLAADKAGRKSIRNSNPAAYQAMVGYFDKTDLYNINKQGAMSELQGQPDYTQKSLKDIASLGHDIYQNPITGQYAVVPAGWMQGLSNGSGGGSHYARGPRAGSMIRQAKYTSRISSKKLYLKKPYYGQHARVRVSKNGGFAGSGGKIKTSTQKVRVA